MNPPPQISETPMPPPVLNYLTPTKAQRHASGGLMLMGMGLLTLTLIIGFLIVGNGMPTRSGFRLLEFVELLFFIALAITWSTTYIVSAVLIKRGNFKPVPIAMVLVLLQTAIFGVFSFIAVLHAWNDDLITGVVVTGMLSLVNIGFGSVIFELWKVMHEARDRTINLLNTPEF